MNGVFGMPSRSACRFMSCCSSVSGSFMAGTVRGRGSHRVCAGGGSTLARPPRMRSRSVTGWLPESSSTAAAGSTRPNPRTKGGPDYGRFVDAVRALQDHARAVDAPDEVITRAAGLIDDVSALLAPYWADEWTSPSGRRMDLPNRGNVLQVPAALEKTADGHVHGTAHFRRFHLGRNGAVHGGAIAMLFDSLLGFTAAKLTRSPYQRTAFLHINYRQIVPIEKDLQVDGGIERIDGRKIFVQGRLTDGDAVLADGEALFVRLRPGQP